MLLDLEKNSNSSSSSSFSPLPTQAGFHLTPVSQWTSNWLWRHRCSWVHHDLDFNPVRFGIFFSSYIMKQKWVAPWMGVATSWGMTGKQGKVLCMWDDNWKKFLYLMLCYPQKLWHNNINKAHLFVYLVIAVRLALVFASTTNDALWNSNLTKVKEYFPNY